MSTHSSKDWRDALGALIDEMPQDASETAGAPDDAAAPEPVGSPKIAYERKGRGGKAATIIYGFSCSDERVEEIGRQMRRDLSVGGSARGGEILLQGDCRDRAAAWLKKHASRK